MFCNLTDSLPHKLQLCKQTRLSLKFVTGSCKNMETSDSKPPQICHLPIP